MLRLQIAVLFHTNVLLISVQVVENNREGFSWLNLNIRLAYVNETRRLYSKLPFQWWITLKRTGTIMLPPLVNKWTNQSWICFLRLLIRGTFSKPVLYFRVEWICRGRLNKIV